MLFPYFTFNQILPFIISAVVIIFSIICYHVERRQAGLILLFFGSIGLGFFIANLDPFLNLWDEQYHALVAKNMMDNPFKPILYPDKLIDYDFRNWTFNHIWLHKQPLFLWQIALSLKIFGISALSVRIPSIIMHAMATMMIYRIGKISNSDSVGFYGALFFSVAYYPLELVAGKYSTDHNDSAFLFYLIASFWSWFEYHNSQKNYWMILIGIFAGCAVLVKWLMGMLVFVVWTITIVTQDRKNLLKWKSFLPVVICLLISILVFLPWQLFIFYKYPIEAQYEFALNARHLVEPIEGHSGDYLFHFHAIRTLYGSAAAIPFLLLTGLFLLIKNSVSKIYAIAILTAIIFTYGFYSMVATKMISYCIIVYPFAFLAIGALTDNVINFLNTKIINRQFKMLFGPVVLITICFFLINLSKIQNYHTDWRPNDNFNRKADLNEMSFIGKLSEIVHHDQYIVFNANVRVFGQIPVMFYTNCIAYDFIPDQKQIENIKRQSNKIAIWDNDHLPGYIQQDKEIVKIKINE